jgi:hypothetical protein
LVNEISLYYDARSKKHQNTFTSVKQNAEKVTTQNLQNLVNLIYMGTAVTNPKTACMKKLRANYIRGMPLFQNPFFSNLFSKNVNINIKTSGNIVWAFFIRGELIFHIEELT